MNGTGLLVLSAFLATPPVPTPDPPVAVELKRATQELLSAIASGDWSVWEKYLDESIVYTAEDGRETDTVFLTPGAPRTRKLFVRDASGRVTRMIDRRDGRDIVWTRSENP